MKGPGYWTSDVCGEEKVDEDAKRVICMRPRAYAVVQEAGANGEYWTIALSAAPLFCKACATLQAWALNTEIRLNRGRPGRYPERRLKAL